MRRNLHHAVHRTFAIHDTAKRHHPAEPRSDQYAFAATAWEILFDAFPFPATTVAELRTRIAAGPEAPSGAPAGLVAALTRGLSPEPSARFPGQRFVIEGNIVAAQ